MTVAAIAPAAVGNAHSQPSTPGNGSRKLSRPANWGRGLANALHAAVRCAELFAKRADNSSDGQPEEYGSALRSAGPEECGSALRSIGPRRGEARFGVEERRTGKRRRAARHWGVPGRPPEYGFAWRSAMPEEENGPAMERSAGPELRQMAGAVYRSRVGNGLTICMVALCRIGPVVPIGSRRCREAPAGVLD